MKSLVKCKSLIEEKLTPTTHSMTISSPGYNFFINSLNDTAKAIAKTELTILNLIKTSTVILKQANHEMNILNIKAQVQPKNTSLIMFCQDVYG